MRKNKYGHKCIVHMHITTEFKAYWLHVVIKNSSGWAYYNHTSACVSACV